MHKGNAALACRYAYEFKAAGADIIKMQFGHPVGDPIRHVSRDMAERMATYCRSIGIELMASIFDFDGLELARSIGMERYKIAHQKIDDEPLVQAIVEDGCEVFAAVEAGLEWPALLTRPNVHIIATTGQYPTPYHLAQVPVLMSVRTGWGYGYSDHTIGLGACLLAVARGARYIEKHVALDPTDLWTKDTSFSATPAQFADLVRLGREIEQVRDAGI